MRRAEAMPQTHEINTPERLAERERVAELVYMRGIANRRQGRILDIVVGPPAAGKSTFADPLVARRGALELDADLAKKELAEFDNGVGADATHIESRGINDIALRRALDGGDNVVMPIIGRPGETAQIVEEFAAEGYITNPIFLKSDSVSSGKMLKVISLSRNISSYCSRLIDFNHSDISPLLSATTLDTESDTATNAIEIMRNIFIPHSALTTSHPAI